MDEWLSTYTPSAERFVTEVLGATPEPWQLKELRRYDDGRKQEEYAVRISIASGHGVGKTTLLAWLILHHTLTHYPQKTAVTAPSSNQLWDALWPEIKSWLARLPPHLAELLEVKAERIELKKDPANSFVSAKAARADQPEALQGVHSANVLLVLDEGSGIPDAVIDAASGSMSGKRVIMIVTGNPLRGQGFFYDTHHKLAGKWLTSTVSVFESRYASKEFAEMMRDRYGEESNQYRVRVLGLFPTVDDDVVIPFEWVEAAIGRDISMPTNEAVIWGLDVAFKGSNRTALSKRRGKALLEPPKAWGGLDDAQVAGRIKQEWDVTPARDRPRDINVDVIGYGAAVVTRLRELGLPARGINVSESPSLKSSQYRNLKAELWFTGREWFHGRDVTFPVRDREQRIEDLVEELTTPTFKPQPVSGKILIEPKKGRKSPDLADSFILTFASESITLQGGDNLRNWKTPLSRPLKGVV